MFDVSHREAPLFERISVIDDPEPRSGPLNMALDELLLAGSEHEPLLVRFYRWKSPTVSFGYFESAGDARRLAQGRGVVRRMTGGGLVEHGDDLTYTLVISRSDPFTNLRSAESYRLIHGAVGRVLAAVGLSVNPMSVADGEKGASKRACFQNPVLHDLMSGDVKVAGGAQRRTRVGLLHQGSILTGHTKDVRWQEIVRGFLPYALGGQCEKRSLAPAEIERASELAAAKYATAAWTDLR